MAEAGPDRTGSLRFVIRAANQLGCPLLVTLSMKNIAISGTWSFSMPDGNITTAVVDVDRACLWIASERSNADADTEIDIYKKGLSGDSYEMEDVSPSLKDPQPCIGPTRRYRFILTAGSTHGTHRKAGIKYKPARSGFLFTGGFSQKRCW